MKKVLIAPSVLSADFARIGEELRAAEIAGADIIHCDVMDGSFVPAITFGAQMIAAMKKQTSLPLDVHLMIEFPERHIDAFAEAGANWITFHPEACRHPHRLLQRIHALGCKSGIALNPGSSLLAQDYLLPECDMLLLMSVNPGEGGQAFIPDTLRKAREACERRDALGLDFDIEIDGGINKVTASKAVAAGVNILVAGSYVFGAEDLSRAISELRA